jgi:UDP-N-acetylmuramoyl-L-alanyl-D-glutamate--2,6-diaminopimelate ligase
MPISNGVKNLIKKFIPSFLLDWYHFILAFFGAFFYCFPSKKLKVIGVTGTKGKSTVVEMTARILEKSGYKTASISSIKFKIGEKEWPNTLKMTMPGRFKLQKFLRQAVKEDCKCAVLEITSEGIKQHRHRFIDFDGAVFTNLTPEHIEVHKGFENYKKAKGKLFQLVEKSKKKNKFSVINIDDSNADYFLNFNTGRKYTYAINNKNAEITPEKISLEISLPAEFNIYNSLAAVCVGLSQGIDLDKILNILKEIKGIPGRMELVIEKPFKVFVDYAHTSDSLEKVYKTLGKGLICVFGSCGGGRDKWKRPEMGKIAAKYCDKIILTNEDPYNENPSQILSEIKSGIPDTKYKIQDTIYEILDRREAINKALSLAKKDDIVIITGKGCEPWMCVAHGKKIPWDDRKIVKEEFEKIYG